MFWLTTYLCFKFLLCLFSGKNNYGHLWMVFPVYEHTAGGCYLCSYYQQQKARLTWLTFLCVCRNGHNYVQLIFCFKHMLVVAPWVAWARHPGTVWAPWTEQVASRSQWRIGLSFFGIPNHGSTTEVWWQPSWGWNLKPQVPVYCLGTCTWGSSQWRKWHSI